MRQKDYNGLGVVERTPGLSNDYMVEHCEKLLSMLKKTKTVEVKSRKGTQSYEVPKYKVSADVIQRLERSIVYYKNLSDMEVKLRDYQDDIAGKAVDVINRHGFVYIAMQVRTGKTLTSLSICRRLLPDGGNVLFLTKKKAISSVVSDYERYANTPEDGVYWSVNMVVINYESMHKVPDHKWDVIVCDEAHSMGAFPKPSQRALSVKKEIARTNARVILLSGTPTPESYSQMYHQVFALPGNPFRDYRNFYKFAEDYVKVRKKMIGSFMVNDYSSGHDTILDAMAPMMISFTQLEAGFRVKTTEEILHVEMKASTVNMVEKLMKHKVIQGKQEAVLGDTPAKLMSKVHQLWSGTVKFESGNSMVVDDSKAVFIRQHFAGKKIAIFYKFKEELNALMSVYGDELTTELDEFNDTCKSIALQIVSGREGISLRKAECLVYYNIDFSATSYWQSIDRMTTMDREQNKIYWVFASGGIEKKIYSVVSNKKDYTLNHFKRDMLIM